MERRLTDERARASLGGRRIAARTAARPTSRPARGRRAWIAATLNYCSAAARGSTLATPPERGPRAAGLRRCGFIAYVNPRLVVTTIPVDGRRRASILLRRGIEPGRGWWAQPGGFLEVDETVARGGDRARRSRRRGCSSCRARSSGSTRASRRRSSCWRSRRASSAARPRTTPEALEMRTFEPGGDPVGRDRVQDLVPRDPRLGPAAAPRRRGPGVVPAAVRVGPRLELAAGVSRGR